MDDTNIHYNIIGTTIQYVASYKNGLIKQTVEIVIYVSKFVYIVGGKIRLYLFKFVLRLE